MEPRWLHLLRPLYDPQDPPGVTPGEPADPNLQVNPDRIAAAMKAAKESAKARGETFSDGDDDDEGEPEAEPEPKKAAPEGEPKKEPEKAKDEPSGDAEWTKLYSKLTEQEMALRQAQARIKELEGTAPPADLSKMSIGDRLKHVGLDYDQVVDDIIAQAGAPSVPGAPPAQPGQQPQDPAVSQLTQLVQQQQQMMQQLAGQIEELKGGVNKDREQRTIQQQARGLYQVLQGNKDRWSRVAARMDKGSLYHAVETAKEMAKDGLPTDPDSVLDAVENYYKAVAEEWAALNPTQAPPKQEPPKPKAEPSTIVDDADAGTPAPRPKTGEERLKSAVNVLRQRMKERDAARA